METGSVGSMVHQCLQDDVPLRVQMDLASQYECSSEHL